MGRVKGSITKDRSLDAEALREVLKPIYEKLREKGVSDVDLPNNEELVDRLLENIDENAVEEWTGKYAEWVKQKP
jgi:pyridoxine 5'-phosphate synthase PdxJ